MTGAVSTLSSSMMRERPPDIVPRDLGELTGAHAVETERDDGLAGLRVEGELRIAQPLARDHDPILDGVTLARTRTFADGDARRRHARDVDVLAHHVERHLRGRSQQIFDALRILHARQLHQDAVGTHALERRLGKPRSSIRSRTISRLCSAAA